MSAYFIIQINITNPENYKDYIPQVTPLVKKFGGELVLAGNIIIRQRGTKVHPGLNVGIGKDHTIFSKINGKVFFKKNKQKTTVSVVPS